jgi:hypothetical protein
MRPKTTTAKPYRVAAGEGLANVWFKTGRLAVKTGGAETDGGFSQFETGDPRGTATALHVHRNEDETFYVLDDDVPVQIGDQRSTSPPATTRSHGGRSRTPTPFARRGRGCSSPSAPADSKSCS